MVVKWLSYLVWPGHESFPLQKLVGTSSHWSGHWNGIVWKHLTPNCTQLRCWSRNEHCGHTKMIKHSLTIEGVNEKRFYLSVFNWIHSVKLCLLLGSTILQEVFLAGPTTHVQNVHSKEPFCGATGDDRCGVDTGERKRANSCCLNRWTLLSNVVRVCYFL